MAGGPLLVQSFFPSFNGFSLLHRPSPEKLMRSGSNCHVHPIVITSSSSSSSDHSTATSTATATTTSIPASVSPQIPLNAKDSIDDPKEQKYMGSPQLSRWARARRIRSSKLAEKTYTPEALNIVSNSPPSQSYKEGSNALSELQSFDDNNNNNDEEHENRLSSHRKRENTIYMVSDGTGWTAEHSVHAALGQFEHCLIDQGCPVDTHLFSGINDVERLMEIIRDAGKENAIFVYTLADPNLAEAAKKACQLHGIPHLDIFRPIIDLLSTHMGVTPLGLPRGAPGRKISLSKQYFKRIEAVEFTIKQDDGALPKNLHKADLVLVGVSRTSKTPLSTYMAQKGYKVANVPLVLGIDPPKELFEIDQTRIYALTINPNYLKAIRIARYKSLGVLSASSYSDMEHIKKELEYSTKLFLQNPKWPVIEVTGKAIEETAAVILRIYHDREKKYIMPRISRRY